MTYSKNEITSIQTPSISFTGSALDWDSFDSNPATLNKFLDQSAQKPILFPDILHNAIVRFNAQQNNETKKTLETIASHSDTKQYINQKNSTGDSPLHLAVKLNNHTATQILLQNNADPNILDNDEYTPGERSQNQAIVQLLRNHSTTSVGDAHGETDLTKGINANPQIQGQYGTLQDVQEIFRGKEASSLSLNDSDSKLEDQQFSNENVTTLSANKENASLDGEEVIIFGINADAQTKGQDGTFSEGNRIFNQEDQQFILTETCYGNALTITIAFNPKVQDGALPDVKKDPSLSLNDSDSKLEDQQFSNENVTTSSANKENASWGIWSFFKNLWSWGNSSGDRENSSAQDDTDTTTRTDYSDNPPLENASWFSFSWVSSFFTSFWGGKHSDNTDSNSEENLSLLGNGDNHNLETEN